LELFGQQNHFCVFRPESREEELDQELNPKVPHMRYRRCKPFIEGGVTIRSERIYFPSGKIGLFYSFMSYKSVLFEL
jgi:hypothetical protein